MNCRIFSLVAALVAAISLAGCAAETPAPNNTRTPAAETAPRPDVDAAALQALTWKDEVSALSGSTGTPAADYDLCTLTADTPVHATEAEAGAGMAAVGKLTPTLFTGDAQAVPCTDTDTPQVLEVLAPVRGGEGVSQAHAYIHEGTFERSEPAAHVTVEGGTMTVHYADGTNVSGPAALGSPEAPTPVGLTYLEARYSDPEETTTGPLWGLEPGALPLVLTGAFSPVADPGGDPRRVHTGIHPWTADLGPTTGCVGVLDADRYADVLALPLGTVIEVL